tara:strand:- start:122443 stop:122661 length:219 start_codon:yes stop_codon:yes gene_type:complete
MGIFIDSMRGHGLRSVCRDVPLTQERHLVTLHVRIHADADADESLYAVTTRLVDEFHVDRATVQIEKKPCKE